MQLQNYFAQDKSGNALPGATVYVLLAGTATMATGLQDKNGAAKTNPFLSDSQGLIQFAAANGDYDIRVVKGPHDYKLTSVRFEDSKQFRLDIANSTDPAKGSNIIGFIQSGTGAVGRSSLSKQREHISVEDFGAISNGIADDTLAITRAMTEAVARGIQDVYLGASHVISSTITIPVGIILHGQGRNCKIKPAALGTFTQGFMFLINSTDGLVWTVAFPNALTGGLRDVVFWNGDVAGTPAVSPLRGVRGFGSCIISGIRGRNMTQMVSRPGAGMYSDHFDVSDVYCEPVIGAEHQVDIRGLGDGLRVNKLHFPFNALNPGTGTPLGLRVAGVYGGTVSECVGGDVFITQSKLTVSACHFERAQITVDDANVDFYSTYLSPSNRIPLVLDQTGGDESVITLNNCEFVYSAGLLEWQGSDISIATGVDLKVDNSYRRYTKNGALDKSQQHGLTIETSAGAPISFWNKYSYVLSRDGHISRGQVVDLAFNTFASANSFAGISGVALDSTETWEIASGTYFYHAQYIVDTGRLIGRTGTLGEQSLALTMSGNGSRITIDYNGKPTSCILRLYRGTSTGSYDKFVDIPIFSARLFFDSGNEINGFPWQARAASGVDTLNGLAEPYVEIQGLNVYLRGAAVPSVGAWLQGDDVFSTIPAAAGKRGWVCVTSGSPGTWKQWGVIDA